MQRQGAFISIAIALVALCAVPIDSLGQGPSLKDQLVGTWIYVSSTGKREDGTEVPRSAIPLADPIAVVKAGYRAVGYVLTERGRAALRLER